MNIRAIVLALLAGGAMGCLGGCTTLTPIPGRPRDMIPSLKRENVVRVQDRRGHAVDLANAHVEGDSLVGLRSIASGERVALPIDDIASVAVQELDGVATTFAILMGAAVTVLALALGVHFSMGGPGS